MRIKRRVRTYLYLRRITKPTKIRKARRHSYVVARKAGTTTMGYWMGDYKGNGVSFTKEPSRAIAYRRRELAQMAADNSMLYRHARYEVVKIKSNLLV